MRGYPFHFDIAMAAALAVATLACNTDGAGGPLAGAGFGRAYGIWTPGPGDTCPAEVHDRYTAVGPDGRIYPTWHPPVDPSGCSFGHDHGRDPRDSRLYADVGPIPFGYANEVLDVWDPNGRRHEDHVGHKVELENDADMNFPEGVAATLFRVRCDVLVKLHQGTHSKDAFTNNLHELVYHIRCGDRTEMHITMMAAIGRPGEFVSSCDHETRITVGPATPPNSPAGGGRRVIPDRPCIERDILVGPDSTSRFGSLRESWETSNSIRRDNGKMLAHFNPYFQVLAPSRFYDPALPNLVGRPIEVCYEVAANGDRARGGWCETATAGGTVVGLTFDDPRSPFNGADRRVDINSNDIRNADGPEVWYTDPFGRNARTEPFPGSIRQWVARLDNDRGVAISGPTLGRGRNYGASGVHAPN